jgi:DNA-binding PadR family transcriptional regulator
MHNLSAFQRDLLVSIHEMGPTAGQTLRNHIEERWGEKINHSRLYPNLDELAALNLIRINKDTGARYNEYELMPLGRREIDAHREWVDDHFDEGE